MISIEVYKLMLEAWPLALSFGVGVYCGLVIAVNVALLLWVCSACKI